MASKAYLLKIETKPRTLKRKDVFENGGSGYELRIDK